MMSDVLRHDLAPLFDAFRAFTSERALVASAVYREAEPRVRAVLDAVVRYDAPAGEADGRPLGTGGPSPDPSLRGRGVEAAPSQEGGPASGTVRPSPCPSLEGRGVNGTPQAKGADRGFVRAVAWNIERGLKLEGVLDVLANHPVLREADILFVTELDFGMARTLNRDVAGEVSQRLGMSGVFVPCYLNLDKGSGVEQASAGENRFGIHGNALFSRWPIRDAAAIRLRNGKDKMRGKEKRIGSQQAAVGTIELPGGPVRCASFHLDAHSSRAHRRGQMRDILDSMQRDPAMPVLLGGDWNTSTHNSSRAIWSIIGFWGRILMGVRYCLREHYPYPDRLFERGLFRLLERSGYAYRPLNEAGACTFHHSILQEKDRQNLLDWVPRWCLDCIQWALKPFGGVCSLKLDWFAGRGLRAASGEDALPPTVVQGLQADGEPLSDHDPIVLDFELDAPRGE